VLLGRWGGLCLGGARYMDAGSTPRGSEITRRDISKCLSHGVDEVDLVLTHDCPAHIKVPNTPGLEHYGATGVPEMAELAEFFQPRFWFFGHHHRWFERTLGGTRYVGLPQGWNGFVLLDDQANCQRVDNQVEFEKPRWCGGCSNPGQAEAYSTRSSSTKMKAWPPAPRCQRGRVP
jgi:hypothetical protein